jgi:hypothetical protein
LQAEAIIVGSSPSVKCISRSVSQGVAAIAAEHVFIEPKGSETFPFFDLSLFSFSLLLRIQNPVDPLSVVCLLH